MRQVITIAILSCALALTASAQVPVVVVNGAGFQPAAPVAPGSYAQVWGTFTGLPTANGNLAQLPLASTLEGVQVKVAGIASPLYAVTPTVCAFNVPLGVPPGRHTIEVVRSLQIVGRGNIDVAAAFPGVFFARQPDGVDVGGVRRAEDNAYALAASPARRGGVIIIALTGQGADINSPVGDGQAPSGAASTTKIKPRVFIAGVEVPEADISYSGLMPLYPGLWQINAKVPDRSFIKGMVPLLVTYGGLASNQVAFWVAQ